MKYLGSSTKVGKVPYWQLLKLWVASTTAIVATTIGYLARNLISLACQREMMIKWLEPN